MRFAALSATGSLVIALLSIAQAPAPAQPESPSLAGTVWDGNVYDSAAGKGAIGLSFYARQSDSVMGSWHATFGFQSKHNNAGVIENVIYLGSAAPQTKCGRDPLTNTLTCVDESHSKTKVFSFELISDVPDSCEYVVHATRGADGHLRGTFSSPKLCTTNHGTIDLIQAH